MKRRLGLGLALAVVAVLVILPIVRDGEDRDVAVYAAARPDLVHAFVELSHGQTHHELLGPDDGAVVVLIHGVNGPMTVWNHTVRAFASAGLRTLRLDLYGRGFSARPDTTYDLDLFVGQVIELVDRVVGKDAPFSVVGSSMGAIVAVELARRYPDRVQRVALVGPAGFPVEGSVARKAMQVPLVGDWLMRVVGDEQLTAHVRRYFFRPQEHAQAVADFREQLRVRGSKRAILSTMRHTPVQDYAAGYAALGRPALVIWGREDRAFPFRNSERLGPSFQLVPVDQAGHLPQVERPDVTGPALVDYLRAP